MMQTLEIPSASITAEIVLVPFADGEYPVTWLDDKAGMLEGSALPGKGQCVLTGHNHLNTTKFGPFAELNSVKEGDRIFISGTRGKIQVFEVYANVKIAENNVDAVNRLIAGDPLSLTLITCEDERTGGGYDNRRVIAARPL
jgi:LPXTG-site transpeptidase (sortase) family protein